MLNPSGGSVAEVIHPDRDPLRVGRDALQLEAGQPAIESAGGLGPSSVCGQLGRGGQGGPGRGSRLNPRGDLHRANGLGRRGGWTHGQRHPGKSQEQGGTKAARRAEPMAKNHPVRDDGANYRGAEEASGKGTHLRGLGVWPVPAEVPHSSRALTVPAIGDRADRATAYGQGAAAGPSEIAANRNHWHGHCPSPAAPGSANSPEPLEAGPITSTIGERGRCAPQPYYRRPLPSA